MTTLYSSSNDTTHIINKLWNLCNILKDDGITYHQYVSELTFLLFLKMAEETNTEKRLPTKYRWNKLKANSDDLPFYIDLLDSLGSHKSYLIREIFSNAYTSIKKASTLSLLVNEIDKLDWHTAKQGRLGDIYEGLLEKNASEKKSGAGQYFTPRPLIESIIELMKPQLTDIIQDPAAGTGGFLISANRYLKKHNTFSNLTTYQRQKYKKKTFYGMEHVHDTYRLALMNLMLHGLDSSEKMGGIHYGDTLSSDSQKMPKATLMLSNPPFGSKRGGGLPSRTDLPFPTSNKQFCFLQHIYLGLKKGGRAAVVVPDNVLFENGVGKQVRTDLMDKCNLHTILRLPTGIFYAQGVNTNVLFFSRGKSDKGNTKEVWIYDLRTDMATFGKRTQLTRQHFNEFEEAFGEDPLGLAQRLDTGENGRFRAFSRSCIQSNDDNLDISWLKSKDDIQLHNLPEPSILATQAINELNTAIEYLDLIFAELES